MDYDELAARLSFYTGISLFKIKYDYIEVLKSNGLIKINNGVIERVKPIVEKDHLLRSLENSV